MDHREDDSHIGRQHENGNAQSHQPYGFLMDVFTLNEFNEKIEKILPVDEDSFVFQDLELAVGTIIENDSDDLKKKTDRHTGNENVANDSFEFGFGVQKDLTPL
jgi:hypothetical protein